jgi:hypothetical protein
MLPKNGDYLGVLSEGAVVLSQMGNMSDRPSLFYLDRLMRGEE